MVRQSRFSCWLASFDGSGFLFIDFCLKSSGFLSSIWNAYQMKSDQRDYWTPTQTHREMDKTENTFAEVGQIGLEHLYHAQDLYQQTSKYSTLPTLWTSSKHFPSPCFWQKWVKWLIKAQFLDFYRFPTVEKCVSARDISGAWTTSMVSWWHHHDQLLIIGTLKFPLWLIYTSNISLLCENRNHQKSVSCRKSSQSIWKDSNAGILWAKSESPPTVLFLIWQFINDCENYKTCFIHSGSLRVPPVGLQQNLFSFRWRGSWIAFQDHLWL